MEGRRGGGRGDGGGGRGVEAGRGEGGAGRSGWGGGRGLGGRRGGCRVGRGERGGLGGFGGAGGSGKGPAGGGGALGEGAEAPSFGDPRGGATLPKTGGIGDLEGKGWGAGEARGVAAREEQGEEYARVWVYGGRGERARLNSPDTHSTARNYTVIPSHTHREPLGPRMVLEKNSCWPEAKIARARAGSPLSQGSYR